MIRTTVEYKKNLYPMAEGEYPRKNKCGKRFLSQGQNSDLVEDVAAAYQIPQKFAGWPEQDIVCSHWASKK